MGNGLGWLDIGDLEMVVDGSSTVAHPAGVPDRDGYADRYLDRH
jgi:hypothetical protein